LYKWDVKAPLLDLTFADFVPGNPDYQDLRSRIGRDALIAHSSALRETLERKPSSFRAISLAELTAKFQRIHQYIWTKEKKSPSAAFEEFMKIVFVKIKKDGELHQKLGANPQPNFRDVVFSTHWISE
jgi:type I restriction enzyme M protein